MKSILYRYSRLDVKPSAFMFSLLQILEKLTFGRIKKIELLRRFIETNMLPTESDIATDARMPAIEILFVCAGKDFEILPLAIEAAISATSLHELHGVTVVVPLRDLDTARNLSFPKSFKVSIVSEVEKLPRALEKQIREVFRGRSGWVIQQLLKVICVSESSAPGVLVCDSDTILSKNRVWFDDSGRQILTPSWERTVSYYEFLHKFGLCEANPTRTFVSHHMLMQPQFMLEARKFMKWDGLEDLVRDLVSNYDGIDPSPFCIEFELYGQYLMHFKPQYVSLVKWSNLSLARKNWHNLDNSRQYFASISLHDYLV